MILRPTTVLCIVAFSLNAHASDMAIVDAVTGNMQRSTATNLQPNAGSSKSYRASEQPISKFDYMARETARGMKCDTQKNPVVEPPSMGAQTLIFTCNDGRELKMQCSAGLGCKSQ